MKEQVKDVIDEIISANAFEVPGSMVERYLDEVTGHSHAGEHKHEHTPEEEAEIARLAHLSTIIMIPWPAAIGYRRFYQGILVRHHLTRRVAYGTVVPVDMMKGQSLDCSNMSSRAACLRARRSSSLLGSPKRRARSTMRSPAACRWATSRPCWHVMPADAARGSSGHSSMTGARPPSGVFSGVGLRTGWSPRRSWR